MLTTREQEILDRLLKKQKKSKIQKIESSKKKDQSNINVTRIRVPDNLHSILKDIAKKNEINIQFLVYVCMLLVEQATTKGLNIEEEMIKLDKNKIISIVYAHSHYMRARQKNHEDISIVQENIAEKTAIAENNIFSYED